MSKRMWHCNATSFNGHYNAIQKDQCYKVYFEVSSVDSLKQSKNAAGADKQDTRISCSRQKVCSTSALCRQIGEICSLQSGAELKTEPSILTPSASCSDGVLSQTKWIRH